MQRILTLDRREGLHGVSAADGPGGSFEQAKVHLALGDSASDVLDRHLRVDPMQVVQLDRLHTYTRRTRPCQNLPDSQP